VNRRGKHTAASKPLSASQPTASSIASARHRAKKKAQGWVDFSAFVPAALRPQINRTIKRMIMIWRAKQAASDNNISKKV
jgi:hypothetical protein